jgi:hypothetical protein
MHETQSNCKGCSCIKLNDWEAKSLNNNYLQPLNTEAHEIGAHNDEEEETECEPLASVAA